MSIFGFIQRYFTNVRLTQAHARLVKLFEENGELRDRVKKHRSAASYWHGVARERKREIERLKSIE